MVNNYHILALGIATQEEIDTIASMALKIDQLMIDFFKKCNVELVDFKLNSVVSMVKSFLLTKFLLIHAVSGI